MPISSIYTALDVTARKGARPLGIFSPNIVSAMLVGAAKKFFTSFSRNNMPYVKINKAGRLHLEMLRKGEK